MKSNTTLIFGNGLTKDTYHDKYQKIEIIYEKVIFYNTCNGNIYDSLFSQNYYPDLVEYMKMNNHSEFDFASNILKNILENNEIFKSPQYWQNIIYFNSIRDYIFKLFWFYDSQIQEEDTCNSGINIFANICAIKGIDLSIISLNYDLVIERHLLKNGVDIEYCGFGRKGFTDKNKAIIYKPHGSINFFPSTYDQSKHGIISDSPVYPLTIDKKYTKRNPCYFHNVGDFLDGNSIGIISDSESSLFETEIVPLGCSNYIPFKYSNGDKLSDYLLPWSFYIYQRILDRLKKSTKIVFIGISFCDADESEISSYIKSFFTYNPEGKLFWLVYDKNQKENILSKLKKHNFPESNINWIMGSFSDNYTKIINLL